MGDGQTVSLSTLPAVDQEAVRGLYAFLGTIFEITKGFGSDPEGALKVLAGLEEAPLMKAFELAQNLGATLDPDASESHKALHDVRGGSLTALLSHLDLIQMGIAGPVDAERVHLLVRDHLKMMRNALYDLDASAYAADLEEQHHDMEMLREKWSDTAYSVGSETVKVQLESSFDGVVSERCMEFSSLDRVLYNLVNNASRFAEDGAVHIQADPIVYEGDTHLRICVVNQVSDAQVAVLRETFGDELGRVFEGGFTTGGHGLGLAVCADLVRHAYSLKSVDRALSEYILGAKIVDNNYVAWFHWPARAEA